MLLKKLSSVLSVSIGKLGGWGDEKHGKGLGIFLSPNYPGVKVPVGKASLALLSV